MIPEESQPSIRGLHVGQKVGAGRFTLTQPLGEGGRGVVWKAVDSTLGGMVAVKFLPPEIAGDPAAIEDLRKETAQSRRLSHPNVVRVYDLFEDIKPFIFMELVEGHTLAQERLLHPRKVLPWSYAAPYVAQLCDALDYAHSEKVVHRDLKPNNVLIDTRRGLVKLVDFGIARVVTESVTRVTQRTIPDGTLVYMSCQQLNGEGASAVDDIYSLGVTLYETLTGKPPFHSGDIPWQIRYGDLASISSRLMDLELEDAVPPYVEETVMACLARDPFKRPQSAREAAERLGLYDAATTAGSTPRPTAVRPDLEGGQTGFATPQRSGPDKTPLPARDTATPSPTANQRNTSAHDTEPVPAQPGPETTPVSAAGAQDRGEGGRGGRGGTIAMVVLLLTAAALYWVKVPAPGKDGEGSVRLYAALLQHLGATPGFASDEGEDNRPPRTNRTPQQR
jgi:serine/threonine protein kinase